MNSHEHKAEAERLLEHAKADVRAADKGNPKAWAITLDTSSFALAAATLHARLAELDDEPQPMEPPADASWVQMEPVSRRRGRRRRGNSLSWDEMDGLRDSGDPWRPVEDIDVTGGVL